MDAVPVGGQPAPGATQDGVTVTALAFDAEGDRITKTWAVRHPDTRHAWTPG